MMRKMLSLMLRLLIVGLIVLPIVVPFLEKVIDKQPPTTLTVWLDPGLPLTETDTSRAMRNIRDRLSLDASVQISLRTYGNTAQTPVEDYEELLAQLGTVTGPQVIVSRAQLWGPAARHFRRELERLSESPGRQLQMMRPEDLGWKDTGNKNERFLALSELSAPQLNFLGEPSQLSLDIIGQLNPGEKQNFEVVVRSGESLLSSRQVSVEADSQGIVNSIQNIPVHFTRAQQQLLTAQISSELSPLPLNFASTPVSVVHSKSTVLHVGVGPDWSLRNMRTKLKFWPNLDLLSYYILREVNDDLSIPSTQLSLIEFPSEKLFGEQLPNFHGVLAQNFAFDSYLNSNDSRNLYEYVNTNGGRLVFQAGPLSFLGRNSDIGELMPCENVPEFDYSREHRWQPGRSRLMAGAQFDSAVSSIATRQTALGCKPKPGALVLAETADEKRSPMIIAYPVGKGLVLAFMAGDWHTFGTQVEAGTATQRAHRVYALDASEFLFQWMVEFLQRRQDSGLRPPQFMGPRIYQKDTLHTVRSRGGMPAKALLQGQGESFSGGIASPHLLTNLGLEAIRWERTAGLTTVETDPLSTLARAAESTRAPRYESAGLNWQNAEDSPFAGNSHTPRAMVWPILEGSTRTREILSNPVLFPAQLLKTSGEFHSTLKKTDEFKEHRAIPLLEAYPWLLAALLALLALEQLLGRLYPSTPAPSFLPAIKSQQKGNG